MAVTNSPNMNLPVPSVGNQPGPDYAINVNQALTLIDSHDHSPGSGVQITPAGLNINVALSLQSNSLTNVGTAVFTAQGSPASTIQTLSVAPGGETPAIQDLFFTDSAGTQVQLTKGGLVNATIASLPGESYVGGTFFWKQGDGSTTPANFDIGSIVLRPNVAATTFGVTLTPPSAIASAYTLQLPALASAGLTNLLAINDTGVISQVSPNSATIQNSGSSLSLVPASVTNAYIVTNQALSSSCGSFTTSSGSAVDVTNLTGFIAPSSSSNRQVQICIVPDGSGASPSSQIVCSSSGGNAPGCSIYLLRNGSVLNRVDVQAPASSSGASNNYRLPASITFIDTISSFSFPGGCAYKIQLQYIGTGGSCSIVNAKLFCKEL